MQLLVCVLSLLCCTPAWAATRYIDDAGSNSNDGTSTSTPWLTWSYAFTNTACGDTLIAMDGTYTTTNGAFSLTKVCTAGTVYTIQAQNERQAYIDKSGGTQIPLYITGSAYITVEGLRARGGDLAPASGGVNAGVCNAYNSNHITFRHMLCTHPNRYRNAGHVYQFYNTHDSLIEESEAHYFRRHGFYIGGGSSRNTIRRNYCNGRDYADLSGAGVENPSTAPSTDGPDDCYIVYPGSDNVFENNIAEGDQLKYYAVEAITGNTVRNKFYGNIGLGGAWNGIALDARGATAALMPTDTDIRHMYIENTTNHGDTTQLASGYRFNGNKTTTCLNCTAYNTVDGFAVDRLTAQPGDGVYSATLTNSLALDVVSATGSFASTTGYGFRIASVIGTWTATNVNAYNSANANYNPSTHANYAPLDTPTSTDPQMGTCKVWRPAGSAAITNNWGAEILYRYENGVLTTTKLWDTVTGEFPHGATVSGITDVGSVGAYNVHTRLNVNTGGCSFPAGYGGSAPTNPPVHHMFSGTGAISGVVTVPAGLDFMGVFIALRDGGLNVGQVSAITSSCGSESFTFGARGRSHASAGVHNTEGWVRAAPTSGTCTVSVATTGTVTSWIMDVFELDNSSGVTAWAANGSNGVTSAVPTVTVPTNTSETVISATSGASSCSISAGANQTALVDELLSPMRLAVSEQSGNSGGVMDYTQGCTSYWATVGASFAPGIPDPPSTATLTQSDYLFLYPIGTEAGAPPIASWLSDTNAKNLPISSRPNGYVRVRAMITGGVATTSPFGVALYCRKNAESYTKVIDTLGSTIFRLYGPGVTPDIPSSLVATSNRLCGSDCVTGAVLRDQSSSFTVPALTVGQKIELDSVVVFQAAAGNTANCRYQKDDGTALDTYSNTPLITFTEDAAGAP